MLVKLAAPQVLLSMKPQDLTTVEGHGKASGTLELVKIVKELAARVVFTLQL